MSYRLFKLKNSPYWYCDFGTHQARRVRVSTGSADKRQALAFAKHSQAELWRQEKLGERPSITWDYAVIEWLKAHGQKKSIEDDKQRLRVLSAQLGGLPVHTITAAVLRRIVTEIPHITGSTRNRYLAIGRTVVNYSSVQDWRQDKIVVQSFPEPRHRIRYLTPAEAQRLLTELPDYLRAMCLFALVTGLRESNVRLLEWSCVDLGRAIAWVHGDQAKAGKDLVVPLNQSAIKVLEGQHGHHWKWVFPLNGRPLYQCNNTAWKSALRRAGIFSFRWHDLRHTWASWHVQNDTSLYDLKALGGWASMACVERYAHMSHERVAKVAGNIDRWLTSGKLGTAPETSTALTPAPILVGRGRLELPTNGLKERASNRAPKKSSSTIIDLRESVHARHVPKSVKSDDSLPREENNVAKKWQTRKGGK